MQNRLSNGDYFKIEERNLRIFDFNGSLKKEVEISECDDVQVDGTTVIVVKPDGSIGYSSMQDEIKNFFFMGEEQNIEAKCWLTFNIKEAVEYFGPNRVDAMFNVWHDYYHPILEPSIYANDSLYYKKGAQVARGIRNSDWEKKANQFLHNSEWHSELATLAEGDLFKVLRISRGLWTPQYVCKDSSSAGNYFDSPKAKCLLQPSGADEVGGFADGVGNTYQIYKDNNSGFVKVGGCCHSYGSKNPVANVEYCSNADEVNYYGCGIIAIKRNIN